MEPLFFIQTSKIGKTFNVIKNNPGLLQCQIAKILGYNKSRSIHGEITALKKQNKIIFRNQSYHALPESEWNIQKPNLNRSVRLTDLGKQKILDTITRIPKSRQNILKELSSTSLSQNQIKNELRRLVKHKIIIKVRPNLEDQREICYYQAGVFN